MPRQLNPLEQKIIKLLQRPNARFKFKHLVKMTRSKPYEVEAAIAELRRQYPNLVFAKFDRTFFLSPTPTAYSFQTDLSRHMPTEGVFGAISDTHLCSNAERLDLIEYAYAIFEENHVKYVFHCGDLMDGMDVYPGHSQNIKVYGGQAQAVYFIKKYPMKPNIKTLAIAGNHDLQIFHKTGVDQVSLVANGLDHEGRHYDGRQDIVYLGQYSHKIVLPQQVTLEMLHPRGNATYAKSYKQQKRSEAMDRNLRPDIQLSGHFHDYNHTWINHTHLIALPGLQDETEFFKRLGLPRGMGFMVIHYKIDEGKVKSLSPELYMFA